MIAQCDESVHEKETSAVTKNGDSDFLEIADLFSSIITDGRNGDVCVRRTNHQFVRRTGSDGGDALRKT